MRYTDSEKRIGVLRRTAKELVSYKVRMKILSAALVMMTILASVIYVSAALYKQTGSFTVSLDKFEMQRFGLTLSESREMTHKTSNLNAKIAKEITNISEDSLSPNIGMIDGQDNGDNYIAYTFYLQNAGEEAVSYEYTVKMDNITQSLDEAIRLRLYVDGVPTTYAKTASDGSGPEPGTKEFYSAAEMVKARKESFQPGGITKFTVVIWIEGHDPDCIDWLIGGQMKISMDMSIVH